MDIGQLLSSGLGQQVISGIGDQVGTSEKETSEVVNSAVPVLMGMLKNNATSPQGAAGLLGALTKEHDGSILNNLTGFLKAGDTSDGNGILKHILGNKQKAVEKSISKQTGVSATNVSKILALLAPIIMGYLGNQTREKDVSSADGLGGLLGSLVGNQSTSSIGGSILSSILQQSTGNSGNKDAGLGGLLGGIFGKK